MMLHHHKHGHKNEKTSQVAAQKSTLEIISDSFVLVDFHSFGSGRREQPADMAAGIVLL
jgi:hypothetical protein